MPVLIIANENLRMHILYAELETFLSTNYYELRKLICNVVANMMTTEVQNII